MLRAIVSYALPKEVNAKVDTIITEERGKAKKDQLKKWISILVPCALHFKRLEIDIKSFYSKKNKTTPYTTKRSYELFLSIKRKDKTKFISLISKHRSIVYDCDHFNQTILHWIAKKDLYDWISFAVHHGAIINSTDSTGRTPLHIACAMNNVKSVMVLLYEMAYPLYRDNQRKAPIELTNDDVIISMLKRDKALYILHSMINGKNFKENIDKLRELGFIIEEVSIDKKLLEAVYPSYNIISCAEATSNNANLTGILYGPRSCKDNINDMIFDAITKGFSELIKRRFVIGCYVLQKQNQDKLFLNA